MYVQNVEIFHATREVCPRCSAYMLNKATAFQHDSASCDEETERDSGWFYWTCFPGCLPDSDAFGPFKSAALAEQDARDNDFIVDDEETDEDSE